MRTEPRIRLDHRFTHLVVSGDTTLLVGDGDPMVLDDPRSASVLPLLDGRNTATEVAGLLVDDQAPEVVHYVLLRLLRAGVAVEVTPATEAEGHPSAGHPGSRLATALQSLWEGRGPRACIDVPDESWVGPGGCRLRIADDYLHPDVTAPSMRHAPPPHPVASPERSLLARVTARGIWLGPVLGEGASCPVCLRSRLTLNLTGSGLVHRRPGAGEDPTRIVSLSCEVPDAVWFLLARSLPATSDDLTRLQEHLHVVGLDPSAARQRHPVPRRPNCPTCGDPTRTVPGPELTLTSRPRAPGPAGGYRIVDPERTLARNEHLLSPLTGVVRRIREVPVHGTDLIHVYTASHAHHYGTGGLRTVRENLRDHSGGKGRTDADARASALCESLERFSSVFRGDEPRRRARYSELAGDAWAPNALMHFSRRQFAERRQWNDRQQGGFQSVPESYDDQAIDWSEVRSLTTGRTALIPSAFLYHGFKGSGDRYCDGDSNGLAAGNCLEEAILQGFLEVAERDAIALWWYNRVQRPGVDLSSDGDAWIADVAAFYDRQGRELWALDLTTDLGIPTFAAISSVRKEEEQDIIFGFGAHLDDSIALTRALTEVNQMLPTVLQTREVRRRRLLPDFTDAVRWWDEATLTSEPYLLPAPDLPRTSVSSPRDYESGDLRDDVQTCVSRADAVGCDVLAYDLTRPDVGFPVAKVVVPGMRHFWRRLGPGRLFEVPVTLGWKSIPTTEEDMNPVSVFV